MVCSSSSAKVEKDEEGPQSSLRHLEDQDSSASAREAVNEYWCHFHTAVHLMEEDNGGGEGARIVDSNRNH